MGQDSEEAAEFVTTVRNEHVKMKEWYTKGQSPSIRSLQDRYGPYPSMWKEALNWPGWKEARKEYLKDEQKGGSGGNSNADQPAPTSDSGNAAPRKRKSRWGTKEPSAASNNGPALSDSGSNKRFAPQPPQQPSAPPPQQQQQQRVMLPSVSGLNPNLTPQQQQELRNMQGKLRAVNERLNNLEQEAARVDALPRGHRDRSPSPPPIYGADGKRKNTRAVRWRERCTAERQDLLEGIMRLSNKGGGPTGLPAGASSLLVRKRVKKIRIPVEEHPNYNFIGLIIGPRGKTQKELESKTGCKIAIRGRGSVKEGARGRRDGKVMDGDNEPLHVVISGDDQRAVDAASDMVEQMLVVIDDEKNVHKQQQLRELALLNGTLKEEDVFCQICGEKGHRSFECPKRFAANNKNGGMAVKCAICGDNHATRDCPRNNLSAPGAAAGEQGGNQQQMDSEYLSFMAELDGKKNKQPPSCPPATTNGGGGGGGEGGNPPPPPSNLPPPPQPGLPPSPPSGPPQPPGANPANFGSAAQHPPTAQQSHYGHYQPQQHGGNGHYQPQQGGYGGGGHYNNQQQQYGRGNYGQQQQQQHYGQQQQQQQQQQQVQVKPGEETAGWDPSSYYGSHNSGAGGFNWWDQ